MKRLSILFLFIPALLLAQPKTEKPWMLGPFQKQNADNPILSAKANTVFYCPIRKKEIRWEEKDVYNPTAVVRKNKVYMIYRAEDTVRSVGGTSRLGLAISSDGIHFTRIPSRFFIPITTP